MDVERAQRIIDHIANGASLTFALELEAMSHGKFAKLRAAYPMLEQAYMRAREQRADLHADSIIDIADTDPDPQRARNRIDARKWHASKMNARIYGERIDVNMQGQIDLGAVIREARQRIPTQDAQVIDYTEVPRLVSTDNTSVPSAPLADGLPDELV